MSRVFMVEKPRRDVDVTPAEEFGEVVVLFDPSNIHRSAGRSGEPLSRAFRPSVMNPTEYARAFLDDLDRLGYKPDVDFIMVTGGMLAVSIAIAAAALRHGTIRLLVFNSTISKYVDKTLDGVEITKGETTCQGTVTSSLTLPHTTGQR